MLLRATKRHALLQCRLRDVLHGCYTGQSCNVVSWRFLCSLLQLGARGQHRKEQLQLPWNHSRQLQQAG